METQQTKYKMKRDINYIRIIDKADKTVLTCAITGLSGCCSGMLVSSMSLIAPEEEYNEIMYTLEKGFNNLALLIYIFSTKQHQSLAKAFEIRGWKRLEGFPGNYLHLGNYTLDIFICNPKLSEFNMSNKNKDSLPVKKVVKKLRKKRA